MKLSKKFHSLNQIIGCITQWNAKQPTNLHQDPRLIIGWTDKFVQKPLSHSMSIILLKLIWTAIFQIFNVILIH
ncbi:protein of unknown function [Legionella longbeachae NSW150]|uniref:Uncharacterized protein n=1 Tax=Legionella longbeachae serogroup 1 (strain NSW150) TaxID=661367 RepID=D3HQS7_LEGLN|nr:protein of unknown function [Legionella longbeachae NSW150]